MELFLEAAKAFATERHEGQTRRDGTTPYITHPVRVAQRLQDAGVNKAEILAAAVLHDLIEDTRTQPKEVFARFGPRVASLVDEVSCPPGMTRSDFTERIASGSARSVLIRIADRLDNLENAEGLDADLRSVFAEEALKLAATALTNPRLDRLFPAERRAFDTLLSELITAGRAELQRGPRSRRGNADAIIATFPVHLR
ncbi:MAG TPA: HD domain-containing protein [Candidatus Thermoplasmatota archaeon]